MDIHTASFEEQPQLSPAFMFQMTILLEFASEVHHTRRIESFPQALYIFNCQLELIVDETLIVVGGIESF